MEEAKTGAEIVTSFFDSLNKIPEINTDVVEVLVRLQNQGKLSPTNISNELDVLRKRALNDKA